MTGSDRAGDPAPGTGCDAGSWLRRATDRFDRTAGRLAAPWRGRPSADAAASLISNLSDYGFVWAIVAAAKARRPGPSRRRTLWALALSGLASVTVNAAAKRAVGRRRPAGPTGSGAAGGFPVLPVRRPMSSSFPSGHTLAAFCAAVALADGAGEMAATAAFATAVAASRIQLGAHHASDVLGGALVGASVGLVARRVAGAIAAPPGGSGGPGGPCGQRRSGR
ncbi:MAG: phosphatase PAP2 family protein [Acidimicrobiales bacterium]